MFDQIIELSKKTPGDVTQYAPLSYAYIGDAVYELVIRSLLLAEGDKKNEKLTKEAFSLVNARTQSAIGSAIGPLLSPEEREIWQRGRNAHVGHVPKSATIKEYHEATAFEALIGWLYLTGKNERAMELIMAGLEALQTI